LIGCGSVGSKMGLHMARAGRGPSTLVDSANIQPHNYARHALYPDETDCAIAVPKAILLQRALVGLKQSPAVHCIDVVFHLMRTKSLAPLVEADAVAVVNTTGAATVREALSSPALTGTRPRVIEACLLGLGRVALMTVEGPAANPSTVDLVCESYLEIHRRKPLRSTVFGRAATELAIGQGCSAATLPLPDSRVSMFAAAMSARLAKLQRDGLPADGGRLLLGNLKDDDISTDWTEIPVLPRIVLEMGAGQVRVSPAVHAEISAEVARRAGSETGGIVFGRYCDVTEASMWWERSRRRPTASSPPKSSYWGPRACGPFSPTSSRAPAGRSTRSGPGTTIWFSADHRPRTWARRSSCRGCSSSHC
jgi:hypothetical protein